MRARARAREVGCSPPPNRPDPDCSTRFVLVRLVGAVPCVRAGPCARARAIPAPLPPHAVRATLHPRLSLMQPRTSMGPDGRTPFGSDLVPRAPQ
jgi:hypothetical protein